MKPYELRTCQECGKPCCVGPCAHELTVGVSHHVAKHGHRTSAALGPEGLVVKRDSFWLVDAARDEDHVAVPELE